MDNTIAMTESTAIEHLQWQQSWTPRQECTIQDLLNFEIKVAEGIHIYFLPRVEDISRNMELCDKISSQFHVPLLFWTVAGWNANGFFGSVDDPIADLELRSHSSQFRFLIKKITPKPIECINNDIPPEYEYDWEFLGFFTLWCKRKSSTTQKCADTKLFLCFDLSQRVRDAIATSFQAATLAIEEGPFVLHDVLVETIFIEYEKALWAFQKPVRWYEKNRYDPNHSHHDSSSLTIRYKGMHELARHIIHSSEILAVASNTLRRMIMDHEQFCRVEQREAPRVETPQEEAQQGEARLISDPAIWHTAASPNDARTTGIENNKLKGVAIRESSVHDNSGYDTPLGVIIVKSTRKIDKSIQFYASMLENLLLRSNAFDERLRNEIKLAFNSVAADDTRTTKSILEQTQSDGSTSKEILERTRELLEESRKDSKSLTRTVSILRDLLEESRKDSKSLTRTVSILTLLFLPGTFIAGFFGMNFFQISGNKWTTSKEIWVFFVVTIPITLTAIIIWVRSRPG